MTDSQWYHGNLYLVYVEKRIIWYFLQYKQALNVEKPQLKWSVFKILVFNSYLSRQRAFKGTSVNRVLPYCIYGGSVTISWNFLCLNFLCWNFLCLNFLCLNFLCLKSIFSCISFSLTWSLYFLVFSVPDRNELEWRKKCQISENMHE